MAPPKLGLKFTLTWQLTITEREVHNRKRGPYLVPVVTVGWLLLYMYVPVEGSVRYFYCIIKWPTITPAIFDDHFMTNYAYTWNPFTFEEGGTLGCFLFVLL